MPKKPDTEPEDSGTETGTTGDATGTSAEVPPEPPAAGTGTTPAASGAFSREPGTSGEPPAPAPADPDAPPWERNGDEFNAETAWQLIQNLRAEVARTKRPAEAGGSDELVQRVAVLEKQLTDERAAAARERIGRQHALPDEVVALLGDGTDDELSARAGALIEWANTHTRPAPARGARRRPVAELRTGTTPEEPPADTDPARLAARVAERRPHF